MNRRRLPPAIVAVASSLTLGWAASGCSLGEGQGSVTSTELNVLDCWDGGFDLGPDFFAAVPYRRTLTIRVQHGGDLEEVSDGLLVLVDDIDKVQAALETPLRVGLPIGVRPVGVPIVFDPNPPLLHVSLYLNRSCHAQNSTLYSTAGTMTFHAIFSGDMNEPVVSKRLTSADFADITMADPRDMAPDGTVLNTSHIAGSFSFYFQRGQPAQPFP